MEQSVTQTRRRLERTVLGLPDDVEGEIVLREEWEVPREERVVRREREGEEGGASPARSGKGKERERGKRRG